MLVQFWGAVTTLGRKCVAGAPQHLGRAGGTTAMQLPDYGQVGGAANQGRALLAEIVA